jgi:hypothetical protein
VALYTDPKGEKVIVSRHPGAIAFIREVVGWETAPVVEQATAADVVDKVVAGNLPLHLACLCEEVWVVEFTGPPPRGLEYGVEEMRAAGARIRMYSVKQVAEVCVGCGRPDYNCGCE